MVFLENSMYVLKAIADSHSSNRILRLFERYRFKQEFVGEILEKIINSINNNPKCVIQKDFWEEFTNKLIPEAYRMWDKIKLPESIRRRNPPEKSIPRNLEKVRKIYELQFQELDKGYTLLYQEACDCDCPLAIYAQNRGIETIFLDKNNPAYHLDPDDEEFDELIQIWRESFWVRKIKPSPKINNSLLVAGKNHIDNKYGLAIRLKKKQIHLTSVLDCELLD